MKKSFFLIWTFLLTVTAGFSQFNSIITTVAGNNYQSGFGYGSYNGDNIPATAADLSDPNASAFDASGNMYIADVNNNAIRKVNALTGIITTVAGNEYRGGGFNQDIGGYTGDGGQATLAELYNPEDIALDASGNLFIADANNNVVRKVCALTGVISTIAGNGYGGPGNGGYSGDGGQSTAAELDNPQGVSVDASGNIFICDYGNNVIREVNNATGIISTVVGSYGAIGYSGDGGQATAAELSGPLAICLDIKGNLYICAPTGNPVIRKVTKATGIISTIAGNGALGYNGDGGAATAAELRFPRGIAVDTSGNIYFGDAGNQVIRVVNGITGIINTIAGNGQGAGEGYGNQGYSGNNGPATAAEFSSPSGVSLDANNNIYIADTWNQVIRKVTALGTFLVTVTDSNANCANTNGVATAIASHGRIPYTYLWTNGATTAHITGLSAGSYGVTVTDANGNVFSTTANILIGLSVTTSVTNVSCNGESNGSLSLTACGGISPYTYFWSNGQTTQTISNLSAGTYYFGVTDQIPPGDTVFSSITITQPSVLNANASILINPSCSNNGSVEVTANGGNTPYTYSWSNGGTTSSISLLSAGTYSVTIADAGNCSSTSSVILTQPATFSVSCSTTENTNCHKGNSGTATATPSGGVSPYTYAWSTNPAKTGMTATGLAGGNYTVTVTDKNGCSATSLATVVDPDLHISKITDSCSNGLGVAMVTLNGGNNSWSFSWAPSGGTRNIATNLTNGTYICTLTHSNGCQALVDFEISCRAPHSESLSNMDSIGSYKETITVYPNPTSGEFTLSGIGRGMKIEVYNYLGKVVSMYTMETNISEQFNISDKPNGIYLIRILDKDGIYLAQKKIIKIK